MVSHPPSCWDVSVTMDISNKLSICFQVPQPHYSFLQRCHGLPANVRPDQWAKFPQRQELDEYVSSVRLLLCSAFISLFREMMMVVWVGGYKSAFSALTEGVFRTLFQVHSCVSTLHHMGFNKLLFSQVSYRPTPTVTVQTLCWWAPRQTSETWGMFTPDRPESWQTDMGEARFVSCITITRSVLLCI